MKLMLRLRLVTAVSLVALGCGGPFAGGQTGDVAAPNCDGQRLPERLYGVDDDNPIGITGNAAITAASGAVASADFSDGQNRQLTLTVTHDAESDGGEVLHVIPFNTEQCDERLDIPVNIELSTGDGAIVLSSRATLAATPAEFATSLDTYAESHAGSFDLVTAAGDAWDASSARLFAQIRVESEGNATSLHGSIELATHAEEDSEDSNADNIVLAEF